MIHLMSARLLRSSSRFFLHYVTKAAKPSAKAAAQRSRFKVQGYMLLEVLLICSCSDFFSRKSFSMRVLCSLALMPVLPNV